LCSSCSSSSKLAHLHRLLLLAIGDNRRQLLLNHDALGSAEHVESDGVEGDSNLLGDECGTGRNGNVLQVTLPVTFNEAR